MTNPDNYRQQAETLRKLAKATSDHDAALAYNMRAVEFEYLAKRAEVGQLPQRETHQVQPTDQGHIGADYNFTDRSSGTRTEKP